MGMFKTVKEPIKVWKKLRTRAWGGSHYLAEMEIPAGARIYIDSDVLSECILEEKARTDKAKCLRIIKLESRWSKRKFDDIYKTTKKHTKRVKHVPYHIHRRGKITYSVGRMMVPHQFSFNNDQCAGGIHFYFTKKAALNH